MRTQEQRWLFAEGCESLCERLHWPIFHLNAKAKQSKELSSMDRCAVDVLYCLDGRRSHHTVNITHTKPTALFVCVCFLFFLSGDIMQQPRRQNNTQDATMWQVFFGILTFLFIKFIPFCQEELAAFIISVEEGEKKKSAQSISLFLADIENSLCSCFCFTTSWRFFAQMCKTCHLSAVMV